MATATFVHDGSSIDYTPGADVAAGAVVVQVDLIGVARTPIAANALGSLAVAGVFDLPKTAGGGVGYRPSLLHPGRDRQRGHEGPGAGGA